jgi:hypothetical protein
MMDIEDATVSPPLQSLRNRHLHKTFTGSNITISEAEMRSLPNLYLDSGDEGPQRYNQIHNTITTTAGGVCATQLPPARNPRYAYGSSYGRSGNVRGYSRGYHNPHRSVRPRVLQTLRKSAKFVFIPKIKDINIVDRYSRIIFPVSFVVFNICYWSFYFLQ